MISAAAKPDAKTTRKILVPVYLIFYKKYGTFKT